MNQRTPFLVKQSLLIVAFAGILGLLVVAFAPMFAENPKFLIALPLAGALLMVLSLNFRWAMMFILMTRSLLDPVLTQTKSGSSAGIGGLLNLFVILLVFVTALRFPINVKKCRFLKPWAFYLAAAAATFYVSPLRPQSLRLWLTLVTYACMFLAPFLILRDEKDKSFWIRLILWSSTAPIGLALAGYAVKNRLFYEYGRLNGTFAHPNILAFYSVLIVTLILYVLKTDVVKLTFPKKVGLLLYLGAVSAVLVFTQTRSAWVACFILFFLFALMKDKKILVYLFIGALLAAATPQVQKRVVDLVGGTGAMRSEKLNSMAWRVRLWQSAVPSILQSPVIGHGLGTFQYYSKDFFSLEKKNGAPAHSVYVETVFESGFVGLLGYLAVFLWMMKALFRRMRTTKGGPSAEAAITLLAILNYLIVCYSDNMQYYLAFNWYFWFFCGLVLASIDLESQAKKPEAAA